MLPETLRPEMQFIYFNFLKFSFLVTEVCRGAGFLLLRRKMRGVLKHIFVSNLKSLQDDLLISR